jgi:uncharacterized protein DUF3307
MARRAREQGELSWSPALLALLVSHLAGDFLLQTDWQALNKRNGYEDPLARQALSQHLGGYMTSFAPALLWVSRRRGKFRALTVAASIAIPHVLVDEGKLVQVWMRNIKHVDDPAPSLSLAVDQSFHVVCLLLSAQMAAKPRRRRRKG